MELKYEQDSIISRTYNTEYAKIKIQRVDMIPYCYKAELITNSIPQELADLMNEWTGCVNDMCLSLLDGITDEIRKYDLWLAKNNVKIFDVEINQSVITFFTKLPTAKGFLDDYPEEASDQLR